MVKGKLVFTHIIQDSQDVGSDDEHMVSRVFVDIEVGGKVQRGLEVSIKQAVDSSYEGADIEVGFPRGYKGPLSYNVFREHVERYYRDSFGASGRAVHFGPDTTGLRMRDNLVRMTKVVDIEVDDHEEPSGW